MLRIYDDGHDLLAQNHEHVTLEIIGRRHRGSEGQRRGDGGVRPRAGRSHAHALAVQYELFKITGELPTAVREREA